MHEWTFLLSFPNKDFDVKSEDNQLPISLIGNYRKQDNRFLKQFDILIQSSLILWWIQNENWKHNFQFFEKWHFTLLFSDLLLLSNAANYKVLVQIILSAYIKYTRIHNGAKYNFVRQIMP